MKSLLKNYLKKLFSDLHSIILSTILAAIFLSFGGIWIFSKKIWDILVAFLKLPTPLWATFAVIFLLMFAHIFSRKNISIPLSEPDPELMEKYHVFWDNNFNMRCLNCGKPLKYSSSDSDPSVFFCSDPKCNSKHILKDELGKKITEKDAIRQLKSNREFPEVELLTGQDVMNKYGFSLFILKQHIEQGLVCYINDGDSLNKKLRKVGERELIADSVYEEDNGSGIAHWLFKTEDVENYIKNL